MTPLPLVAVKWYIIFYSTPHFILCWLRLIPHENHVIPSESPPPTKNNLSGKIQSEINANGSFDQVFSQ